MPGPDTMRVHVAQDHDESGLAVTRAGMRDACHAAMSDARHATARLPIFTGEGSRPAAISRYMDDVALKPVRVFSSGRRMNCSGTDMLSDTDTLCSRATGDHTQCAAKWFTGESVTSGPLRCDGAQLAAGPVHLAILKPLHQPPWRLAIEGRGARFRRPHRYDQQAGQPFGRSRC